MRCLWLVLSAMTIGSGLAHAGQTVIPDYDTARDDFFWPKLYADGGDSIYCGQSFAAGERLTVEHAFPADWMAEAKGCDDRECDDPEYKFAAADLHNLWPANQRINSSRGDRPLGNIPGEDRRRFTDICPDYERTSGSDAIVEPRDAAKGDLARSILYMAVTYDMPIRGSVQTLICWHEGDAPDDHERLRNDEIEQHQETRNPFIDYPEITGIFRLAAPISCDD